jgi:hypothetical protein
MRQQSDTTTWTGSSGDQIQINIQTGGQSSLYQDTGLPSGGVPGSSAWAGASGDGQSSGSMSADQQQLTSILTSSQHLLDSISNLPNMDLSGGSASDQALQNAAMNLAQSTVNFDNAAIQQFTSEWGNSSGNSGGYSGSGEPGIASGGGYGAGMGGGGGVGAGCGEGSVAGGTGTGSKGSGAGEGSVGTGCGIGAPGTGDGGVAPGSGVTGSGTGDGGAVTGTGGAPTQTGDGGASQGTGGAASGTGDGGAAPIIGGSPGSSTGEGGTTAPVANGDGFAIQNGQLQMNGQLLNGIAVTGEYAQQVGAQTLADQISSQFPGINVVRLATSPDGGAFTNGTPLGGGESVQDIDNVIQALNAKGIGVIVDNHGSDANTQNNVSQDGGEAAWFGQLAQDNLGNNMVMFQTQNEPMGSDQDIVNEQQSAYNAIRATGSNAIVAFDLMGGGSAEPQMSNPGVYDSMTNYVIDAHAYASNNPDPMSAVATEIAQTSSLTEANGGAVPVYIGETGNAIDGANIDGAATQLLNGVWSDGTGAVAWLYDGAATGFGSGNGADMMTNPDGSLTAYGQEIAQLIGQGAA